MPSEPAMARTVRIRRPIGRLKREAHLLASDSSRWSMGVKRGGNGIATQYELRETNDDPAETRAGVTPRDMGCSFRKSKRPAIDAAFLEPSLVRSYSGGQYHTGPTFMQPGRYSSRLQPRGGPSLSSPRRSQSPPPPPPRGSQSSREWRCRAFVSHWRTQPHS
jgi:hypothetical protein